MYKALWLDYAKSKSRQKIGRIYCLENGPLIQHAIQELEEAFFTGVSGAPDLYLLLDSSGEDEAYEIHGKGKVWELISASESGLLYAVHGLIRLARCGKLSEDFLYKDSPSIPLRMIDHWDNLDGSIERGYSGRSFFFREQEIIVNERTEHYARLLSSIGINSVCFNNVNVAGQATALITDRYYADLNRLFAVFQSYGIKPFLSLNYASPIELGGLTTADPLAPEVIDWWEGRFDEVFTHLPQLGGFVVKADSEGRPGPFTYGRNQAEGANLLGRLLQKHDAFLIWRAFVYNCQQDWRDKDTDRARAAFDYFSPLDGQFAENVFLQIKNGPMDFQVREPVSPLFFAMDQTNLILEFQIAQEYTGHQIDLCYLLPMWKEILSFTAGGRSLQSRITQPRAGIAAVANTGDDENWCGNDLASANFYGFGRLAWNPDLGAEAILREWLLLMFPEAEALVPVMMASWDVMEKYTAPLGIGWMVQPHLHYGPSVDGYEYSKWGTYHRADHEGIGIDRTLAGTGYASLYPAPVAGIYEDLSTCPDEFLLFFHHVPYTHLLKSGKTVIQHIYDSHFEGAMMVEQFLQVWETLKPVLAEDVYLRGKERFERQVKNAREWRDQVNTYFFRKSGIEDEKQRMIYR